MELIKLLILYKICNFKIFFLHCICIINYVLLSLLQHLRI